MLIVVGVLLTVASNVLKEILARYGLVPDTGTNNTI